MYLVTGTCTIVSSNEEGFSQNAVSPHVHTVWEREELLFNLP